MKKKAQIIMISTNKKAHLYTIPNHKGLFILGHAAESNNTSIAQHLYVIINKEESDKSTWINEGDWYIANNTVFRADSKFHKDNSNNPNGNHNSKKIIATTDNSLGYKDSITIKQRRGLNNTYPTFKPLPQIPQQFIEQYIKSYNETNIITNVEIEYDNDKECWKARNQFNPNSVDFIVYSLKDKEKYQGVMFDYYPIKLKIDSNNCIIINKVKDNWNREEVESLCRKAYHQGQSNIIGQDNWIKKNL